MRKKFLTSFLHISNFRTVFKINRTKEVSYQMFEKLKEKYNKGTKTGVLIETQCSELIA